MTQPSLLDALATRDEAIDRVEANAHDLWLAAARQVLEDLCATHDTITSDDLWLALADRDVATHEPRAMGAVLRQAARDGLISGTRQYRPSVRPECHARPIREWVVAR